MPYENTVERAVATVPAEEPSQVPSAGEVTRRLAQMAVFLDSFPGLAAPTVTVHHDAFTVQFSHLPAQDQFLAVARVADALGLSPQLMRMSDGSWHFGAEGRLWGNAIVVFASTRSATDTVRARDGEAVV